MKNKQEKVLKEVREEFCPGIRNNEEWIDFEATEVKMVKRAIDLTFAERNKEIGKVIDDIECSAQDNAIWFKHKIKKELGIK